MSTLGFFGESWYFVGAYEYDPFTKKYRRLYARGPMWLSSSAAETEFLDTVESFWGRAVFMWKWVGHWQLERGI